MPSSKTKKGGNHNAKSNAEDEDDFRREGNQKLQAVVLVDAVFGSKITARGDYQSFGLKPWSLGGTPSMLCRLNNVPLVDYVLDFLASNGVEQVIFVMGACACGGAGSGNESSSTALEDYLRNGNNQNPNNNNPNNKRHSTMPELLFLKDTSLTNAGDALRELYKRNWIRATNPKQAKPFFLVSGDVVADLDLRDALKAHKERSLHDSAAVMTVVLKPVHTNRTTTSNSNSNSNSDNGTATTDHSSNNNNNNNTRPSIVPRASDLVVGLVPAWAKTAATVDAQPANKGNDTNNNANGNNGNNNHNNNDNDNNDYRIMYYDNGSSPKVGTTVPCSFLTTCQSACTNTTSTSGAGGLIVRHDLLDTGISICSPDVLGRLEDEFDYLDLAQDFVTNSVAEEEDGLQTRIYAHVLSGNNGNGSRNYAARAVDFQTYHAISRDLLQRWAYPTVADRTLLTGGGKSGSNNNSKNNNAAGDDNGDRRYKLCKVADYHYKAAGAVNRNSNWARRHNSGATGSQSPPQPLQSVENTRNTSSGNSNNNNNSHHSNHYQYKEILHPTKVGRTSVVHGPGMMGSHVTVGEACLLEHCVLGDSVVIGDGAELIDCHVMDGATIESGARLNYGCVVAKNAVVKQNAVLGKGCFVGEDCVIGAGVALGAFSRITLAKDDDDDDWGDDDYGYGDTSSDEEDDSSSGEEDDTDNKVPKAESGDTDHAVVGPDGKGRLWKPTLEADDYSIDSRAGADDEDNDNDNDANVDPVEALLQLQSIGGDPTSYYRKRERRLQDLEAEEFEDDGFSDHEDQEEDYTKMAFSKFTGGTVTFDDDGDNLNYVGGASRAYTAADELGANIIGRQKGVDVVKEMTEICMEFDDESHPIENLSIELNSFKFSQNATYSDCASACLLALLRKMEVSPAMKDGRLVSLLKAKLDKFWTGMLQKLCRGIEEELAVVKALEHAATVDQQQSLASSQSNNNDPDEQQQLAEIAQKLRSGMAFRFVLQTLHDQEVLSEDAILAWANERRGEGISNNGSATTVDDNDDDVVVDPRQAVFRMASVQAFLEWLEEESSSDDDESGSDDSDSDED